MLLISHSQKSEMNELWTTLKVMSIIAYNTHRFLCLFLWPFDCLILRDLSSCCCLFSLFSSSTSNSFKVFFNVKHHGLMSAWCGLPEWNFTSSPFTNIANKFHAEFQLNENHIHKHHLHFTTSPACLSSHIVFRPFNYIKKNLR